MAALSEIDLRAILGDNYREKLNAAAAERGISDEHRQAKVDRLSLEDKKFPGLAAMLIGIALLAAGAITREPTFWIQAIVAAVFFIAGVAWLIHIRRLLSLMDIRLTKMSLEPIVGV